MKKLNKFVLLLVLTIAILATSATAFAADFGAAGVEAEKNYTIEQMLSYAMQDEYLALAEYTKITEVFGAQRPLTNIMRAETTHIALLKPLFEKYNVAIPQNTAGSYVVVPDSLASALKAGVDAEFSNIEMYEQFLKQSLPDDVKSVFTSLMNASQKHLNAFSRNNNRMGGRNGRGMGRSI
jgi:hypothetical protein